MQEEKNIYTYQFYSYQKKYHCDSDSESADVTSRLCAKIVSSLSLCYTSDHWDVIHTPFRPSLGAAMNVLALSLSMSITVSPSQDRCSTNQEKASSGKI